MLQIIPQTEKLSTKKRRHYENPRPEVAGAGRGSLVAGGYGSGLSVFS
jgi:hypothetical protein